MWYALRVLDAQSCPVFVNDTCTVILSSLKRFTDRCSGLCAESISDMAVLKILLLATGVFFVFLLLTP